MLWDRGHGVRHARRRACTRPYRGAMARLLERERELAAVEQLLAAGGGVLVSRAGRGSARRRCSTPPASGPARARHEVLRARGSRARGGVRVRRRPPAVRAAVAQAGGHERDALLAGAARAVRPLLLGEALETAAADTSFAVLHGLYWLTVNLAERRPVLIAVDDAHWADEPSLRWLAHLAPRLEAPSLGAGGRAPAGRAGLGRSAPGGAARGGPAVLRPGPLSEDAVVLHRPRRRRCRRERRAVRRRVVGDRRQRRSTSRSCCGRPPDARGGGRLDPAQLAGRRARRDRAARARRVQALDPRALGARAGAGHARGRLRAAPRGGDRRPDMPEAIRLAAGLVRPRCWRRRSAALPAPGRARCARGVDPGGERDAAHRSAAAPAPRRRGAGRAGRGASRRRASGRRSLGGGAPAGGGAGGDERGRRGGRRAARARAGRAAAAARAGGASCARRRGPRRAPAARRRARSWRRRCALAADPRERAEIALELAEAYAALFRWVDAVDVMERALAELGEAEAALAARLEGELVVCGLHDARRAARVAPVLERLASRSLTGSAAEALAVAQGMAMVLAGRPAARPPRRSRTALCARGRRAPRTGTRAPRCCGASSPPSASTRSTAALRADARRGPTAPAARAASSPPTARSDCSSCGSGALPEADAAARVALRVLQEGDFAPGLAFAATVLADVAVEAGELDEAQALLALLPQDGLAGGRRHRADPGGAGRLRLAQGRPADALADFETCAAMFGPAVWGMEMRDVGYLHARSGAALALLRLGERDRARELAEAELADVRAFGAPRALGIALRVAGLASGGEHGLELLAESVAALRGSPALLERAHSLAELGAALRRAGRRAAAREPLAEALDLAARCGARRWPPARARSSGPPAPGRGARGAPAWRRSRRASCASRGSRPRAAPTARSPTSST